MLVLSLIKPLGDEKPFAEEKWLRRYSALTPALTAEKMSVEIFSGLRYHVPSVSAECFRRNASCTSHMPLTCPCSRPEKDHFLLSAFVSGGIWNSLNIWCRLYNRIMNEQLWYDSEGCVAILWFKSNKWRALTVIALKWSRGVDTMERWILVGSFMSFETFYRLTPFQETFNAQS